MEAVQPEIDLTDEKHRILAEVFGFSGFRPGQAETIDAVMAGESALAVMPTGAGKSLCFQVPALALGGLTIVVSPLLALMQDQVVALQLAGVRAETINSARDRSENVDVWRRVAAGEVSLLYLSPERLMTERMLAALARLPIKLIAVDEAHCISQWGPAFRPEYSDLSRLRQLFPGVPLVALTATADAVTRRDIADKLFGSGGRIFVQGFDRPNIRLDVAFKQDWKRQMLAFLRRHGGESGIVYCLSRKKTEETAILLLSEGIQALPYHAGMEKWQRDANQDRFMREDGIVMVATIAFGMGIDKPDVRFVLHTDLPGSMEAYYQEFGRAGRDGAPAQALMLYGLGDIRMRRQFIEQEGGSEERRRQEHKRLDALLAYCEAPQCRRQTLLAYFGEEQQPCGHCDLCLDAAPPVDGTDLARLALSAVRDTGQRFGAAHIVDVLYGANNEKVRKFGHDRLDSHGGGKGRGKPEWQSILRQLLAGGYLALDLDGYGGMALAARGQALLRGEEGFPYRPDAAPRAPAVRLKSGKTSEKLAEAQEQELSARDLELLAELKTLRSSLSKARNVPAYVVFSDRSLLDMAQNRPATEDEFAQIHGVGQAKLKKFAAPFLAVISEHA
ncbi:MAG: DNA helicase RecQ [Alphaproteobacteria bacterium]|nr:DNA helicase RecQ [Alphaproteobacteria bacterium]